MHLKISPVLTYRLSLNMICSLHISMNMQGTLCITGMDQISPNIDRSIGQSRVEFKLCIERRGWGLVSCQSERMEFSSSLRNGGEKRHRWFSLVDDFSLRVSARYDWRGKMLSEAIIRLGRWKCMIVHALPDKSWRTLRTSVPVISKVQYKYTTSTIQTLDQDLFWKKLLAHI